MTEHPTRLGLLKPGTAGRHISVITNCYAVKRIPGDTFVHYNEFPGLTPPPGRSRALKIVEELQLQNAKLFNPRAAFDGKRNMYRTIPLDLPNNDATFHVNMGGGSPQGHSNIKGVLVRIANATYIDPRSIYAVLEGRTGHSPESHKTMGLLNILIRQKPILTHFSNAHSFFPSGPEGPKGYPLKGGLELRRGLFQSVRPTLYRLYVNVDITTAVWYASVTLVDLMLDFLDTKDVRNLSPVKLVSNMHTRRRLERFIEGLLVISTVAKGGKRPKTHKITKIVMKRADEYIFTIEKTGEKLSISKYFERTYNYRVHLTDAICIETKPGIVFPIQALRVKEGQFYRKMLPPSLAPEVLKYTTKRPQDRFREIQAGAPLLGYGESPYLRQFGMEIDNQLMQVDARVLPPTTLGWGKGRSEAPRDGKWNVVGKALYNPVIIKAWAVIIFDPSVHIEEVQHFVTNFVAACKKLGMTLPPYPPIVHGRPQGGKATHYQDLEQARMAASNKFQASSEKSFLLVILPDSAMDIKISVKRWGDCERGYATQCMKVSKVRGADNQFCNNLALKVNVKQKGGINSVPMSSNDVQVMEWLAKEPTIIMGADVSHAPPNSDRPSVTGLVSSVDSNFCLYGASSNVQAARQEIIEDISDMVTRAIKNFCDYWEFERKQPCLPRRIIFYRDGVSESQFDEVARKEVNEIKGCLARIWTERKFSGAPPKLTFIIVAKRHHIRLLPRDGKEADVTGNCPAGVVVDRDIVSPVEYDFYLASHTALKGVTSRPAHYSVINDDNRFNSNQLQEVSYMLCHVYAVATRSVSIPAPVYYAHNLCKRGPFHSELLHAYDGDDSTSWGEDITIERHREAYKHVAPRMITTHYWS